MTPFGRDDYYISSLLLAAIAAVVSPALVCMALYRLGEGLLLGEGASGALRMGSAALASNAILVSLVWFAGWAERARHRTDEASVKRKGIRASRRRAAHREEFKAKHSDYLGIPSRVRRRWMWTYGFSLIYVGVAAVGTVVAILALDMIEDAESFVAAITGERFTDGERFALVGLMALVALLWLAVSRMVHGKLARIGARHRRVADQVRALATARGWAYDNEDTEEAKLDGSWTAAPFDRVIGLTAMPRAYPQAEESGRGAAWLEGDFGPDLLPYRSFTSRVVWADLPRALEVVDLVPERMSDAVFKLLGGRDVDVESYDFNRRWRVKATNEREAHGILQPRMIDFLNSVEDPSVAFHVDGERVLIWDDGKDEDVDLDARVTLLEEFIDRLPGHLR
jgi:hypothetical protein